IPNIELPPGVSEPGRRSRCVVVVMPRFADAREREEEVIMAGVSIRVRPGTPQMANGIDAPDRVVYQHQSSGAAPERTAKRRRPRAEKESGNERRQHHSRYRDEGIYLSESTNHRVLQEIDGGAVRSGHPYAGYPSVVCVNKAAQPVVCITQNWRMRVALAIT